MNKRSFQFNLLIQAINTKKLQQQQEWLNIEVE